MSLDLEREQTVQLLCRQFALDHLSTQELESRIEAAYKAESSAELAALTAGLAPVAMSTFDPDQSHGGAVAHYTERRSEQRVLSLFASVRKRGDWEPAEHITARAWFGELTLDFREARMPPGVTTVHASSVFGQLRIIVPPGLRVECDGSAILGEFKEKMFLGASTSPDAPMLKIVGISVMATVEVRMRMPDENAMQALKREWGR